MKPSRVLPLLLAVMMAAGAAADRWARPEALHACSAGKEYCVVVAPKPIESALRYFDDLAKGRKNPGGSRWNMKSARAVLERREPWSVLTFDLLNEVSPVSVLVSSNGSVVTFDNWHLVGHGDNVVVIYRSDGKVVKQYSLEQLLSKKDVERMPRSVSSIWWGGEHSIDEQRGHVVLQVVREGTENEYTELRLDLATGEKVR